MENRNWGSRTDTLELRNAVFKMRDSFHGLKNILDAAEGRVGKPEDPRMEKIQNETDTQKPKAETRPRETQGDRECLMGLDGTGMILRSERSRGREGAPAARELCKRKSLIKAPRDFTARRAALRANLEGGGPSPGSGGCRAGGGGRRVPPGRTSPI